ncbi:MAG: NACHT domain-containing protein [Phormidium sp.]
MSQAKLPSRVRINEEGLNQVRLRMDKLEKPRNPDKRGWVKEDLVEKAYVSLSTVKRFLGGKPCYRNVVISILETLNFEAQAFITKYDLNLNSTNKDPKLDIMIDWQQVCREMLQEQQEEQRFRRRATEQGFELNVYVPLGLVERKEQQRHSGILPMEQEVITDIYQHDEFLNDVIGQQSIGKNKHIAIVGEPGTGKTTLLNNIATYIQKNTQDLPICISLASLQGRTLKNYILKEWLPEATSLTYPDIDIEMFHEKSLQKRLRQGGVWLLLDGVDEIGESSPAKALERIQNQLTDWLGKVRVVLTCRTNVWDTYLINPLTGFDTYKTQKFSQADVRRFIKQWFGFARKPHLGKLLWKKLNEPQKNSICQLVKNPLQLALLCQVFNRYSDIPNTATELFVRYFYDWKPTLSSVDWTTELGLKKELHKALGRLSIAGLDSDARFRLPESLIKKELDDRLFKLVRELGWLNLVDRDAKTDEPVYAFFHSTFQEYFAALNIPSWVNIPIWDYFLPSDHNNNNPKPVDGKKYRIFEPQWNGVFSLWLQRGDVDTNDKEKFIEALVNFNDGIDHLKFYSLKSYYLAQDGLSHFTGSKFHENFPIQAPFFEEGEEIEEVANYFLEYTAPPRTIYDEIMNQELQYFLPQFERLGTSWEEYVSNNLIPSKETEGNNLDNDQSNLEQINDLNVLVKLLETENRWAVIQRLLKIGEAEPKAVIDTLTKVIDSNRGNIYINSSIAWILGGLALGDLETVKTLIRLIQNSKDYLTQWLAAQSIQANLISEKQFILKDEKQMREIVSNLKNLYGFSGICEVLYYCAKDMSYPDFYDAWHKATTTHPEAHENILVGNSTSENLPLTRKIEIIQATVASDPNFNDFFKLICIDGSYFSDQNNPATDIYIEMVEQGCPKKQEEPNTMQQLKKYWRLDLRKLEKRVALLFYNSKNDRTLNPSFLSDIATFGGTIAIISDRPCENLRLISPNDPNLIDTVLKWLKREVLET